MERIPIGDLFDLVAHGERDRLALVFRDRKVRWTYRDALAHVQRLAKALIGLGIDRRDHVAIWAPNRPEWVLVQLAVAKVGGVLVPIDPAADAEELARVLSHSDATTLFLTEHFRGANQLAALAAVCPELSGARPGRLSSRRFPLLKRVVLLDDRGAPGVLAWSAALATAAGITDHLLRQRQESIDAADTAHLQYAAGTPGAPKGAELTHHNVVNTAYYAGECMRLTGRDRLCVPVPFADCFGSVLGTIAAICRGATMVVPAEDFDAELTLDAVAAEHCTALHGTPSMFMAELAQRRFHEYDLSALRGGIVAGAPRPLDLMQQIAWRMHARELTVAHGHPEASGVVTQTRTEDPLELRVSTVGRPLPHVELKIAEPATGREVARGEEGELCCRGYVVMRGYYKDPEATAAAINRARWLHTGDLAVMDEHGYCRVTGRVEDVVSRDGEVVDTREVETLLRSHPDVRDAHVFAFTDAHGTDELAAWIRTRGDTTATPESIRDFCRGRIGYGKIPRHVRFVESYPATPAGMVLKDEMRRTMTEELKPRRAL